jgi:hypothetical protein
VKATKQTAKTKPQLEGLVGFFGHLWGPDPDIPGESTIRYQFEIVRKIDDARYAIQFYSFMDGSPRNLGVMPEAELLGPNVKLYASHELWKEVADELADSRWSERQQRREGAA